MIQFNHKGVKSIFKFLIDFKICFVF